MRVYLYVRVSKADIGTEREQDPAWQERVLREDAARRGDVVAGVFTDRESGGDFLRPEFLLMLEGAKAGRCDVVRVWKVDRLTRGDPFEGIEIIRAFMRLGVHFQSVMEPLIDTTDSNPLPPALRCGIWGLLLSSGYQERQDISRRTRTAIAIKRRTCVCSHQDSDHGPQKGACRACPCPAFDPRWKGGRPKGSRSRAPPAERRWDQRPSLSAADIASSALRNPRNGAAEESRKPPVGGPETPV